MTRKQAGDYCDHILGPVREHLPAEVLKGMEERLSGAWSGFLEAGKGDASCLGPLAGLDKQRARYAAAVDSLSDGALTRLILVARPRTTSLSEAARTSVELAGIGISNQHLAINGVMDLALAQNPSGAAHLHQLIGADPIPA